MLNFRVVTSWMLHSCPKTLWSEFIDEQIEDAKEQDSLLGALEGNDDEGVRSHHLWSLCKSILRGCFDKVSELEAEHGFNPNNGIQDLYDVLETLDEAKRTDC